MTTRTASRLFCAVFTAFLGGCSATVLAPGADGGGDASVEADRPPVVSADHTPVALSCERGESGYVNIHYAGPNNEVLDCQGLPGMRGPGLTDRTAAVMAVTDDAMGATLTLDFCSPAADCVPLLGTLQIRSPGFNLGGSPVGLRPGQYVRIRARPTQSFACSMQIEISNAPSWDGSPNPVRHDSALLAAAAFGEASALPGAPLGVSRQSIGCMTTGASCGGGMPEQFALLFQGHCNTCESDPAPETVLQGHAATVGINSNTYTVRNLRSFNSGACDDYWNYVWTAREIWLE